MIVEARQFTSTAEMQAAAAAVRARLMKPKIAVKPKSATSPLKIIPFMARKLNEWQRRPTHFDAHVIASKPILELIKSGQIEMAPKGRMTIAHVVGDVLRHFPDVSLHGLKSQRRTRILCLPRAIAMYEAKMQTGQSYPTIGKWFGGRDHTTVMAACQKVEAMIVDGKINVHGIEYRVKGVRG